MTLIYVLLSALCNGIAQLFWKESLQLDSHVGISYLLTNKLFLIGTLIYGLSIIIWLGALSGMEVSKAYPLLSLSYVVVTIGGYYLGEEITWYRIFAIGIILVGVLLLSRS